MFVTKATVTYSLRHRLHTLTAVVAFVMMTGLKDSSSTQPSTVHGMVKCVSAFDL